MSEAVDYISLEFRGEFLDGNINVNVISKREEGLRLRSEALPKLRDEIKRQSKQRTLIRN